MKIRNGLVEVLKIKIFHSTITININIYYTALTTQQINQNTPNQMHPTDIVHIKYFPRWQRIACQSTQAHQINN